MHGITAEAIGAEAAEAAIGVQAIRVAATWSARALVQIDAALCGTSVAIVSRRAVAAITALEIRTDGTGSAHIRICALIEILAAVIGIAHVALGADARVIAGRVDALGVGTAGQRIAALVDVRAQHLAVARVTVLALAEEVRRQITALGILHATRRYRRILAFVNVCKDKTKRKPIV